MTTSTESNPIYSEAISGWMATHQGRMPGVVPTSGEPEDDIVVDTHTWTTPPRTASPPRVATAE